MVRYVFSPYIERTQILRTLGVLLFFVLVGCGGQPEDDLEPSIDSKIPALVINPTSITVTFSSLSQFTPSGGVPPYELMVPSLLGQVNSSGLFTSGSSAGVGDLTLRDSIGTEVKAQIRVVGPVSLSPATSQVGVNGNILFSASGGQAPYAFSLISGLGSIGSTTGLYTAPSSTGSAVVRVTDSLGQTSQSTVTISQSLAVNPSSVVLGFSGMQNFAASGGSGSYAFTVISGGGLVNSAGDYTAPSGAGVATLRVNDSSNTQVFATITIVAPVQLNTESITLAVGQNYQFIATQGRSPYSFNILAGGGVMNASTGDYTAPSTAGQVTIQVTDQIGQQDVAFVSVLSPVTLNFGVVTLAVNNTVTLSASGGLAPYDYVKVNGAGSIDSVTGVFTAGSTPGLVTIGAQDSFTQQAIAVVDVRAALTLSPTISDIFVNRTVTLSSQGGVPPYTFAVTAGDGSVHPTSGVFVAPSAAGVATVRVTDARGNQAQASVNFWEELVISPQQDIVLVDTTIQFSAVGGQAPYTFSQVTGTGSIDDITGEYTSGSAAEAAIVRVTDNLGFFANATISVYEPLNIDPAITIVAPDEIFTFLTEGGFGAISFSIQSGTGGVDPVTGEYQAPSLAGIDTIQAVDALGNIATATVSISSLLQISPSGFKMGTYSTRTFSATGGVPPYSFDILDGDGSIHPTTGLFTAPTLSGISEVRVMDSIGSESVATVTIVAPVQLFSGSYNNCLLFDDGSVKCWGDGASGKLLAGSTTDRGDGANEMGSQLAFLNFGDGRTVKDISIGYAHACAILDNDRVKCWGSNANGRLGLGDTANRGDGLAEVGDGLPYVDLGTNRTAKNIYAGDSHTCAILDNNQTKCWGSGQYGKLGLGTTITMGDGFNEMGDALPAVDLGTNRFAKGLALGNAHTCAHLDDDTVKCWGRSNRGQLGYGNTATLGDGPNEMGDLLQTVNLGSNRKVKQLVAGQQHNCAILDDDTIKCWGYNNVGQLGQGNTLNRGDGANEMGDLLAPTLLGGGLIPAKIVSFNHFNCVMFTNASVKCWGQNTNGGLGQGSTLSRGDGAGEMGDALAFTDLGGSFVLTHFGIGYNHGCALSADRSVKCWGRATQGALGNASTTNHRGDVMGEMGDNLSFVSY